jgi:hypothetical protein
MVKLILHRFLNYLHYIRRFNHLYFRSDPIYVLIRVVLICRIVFKISVYSGSKIQIVQNLFTTPFQITETLSHVSIHLPSFLP